MLVLVLVLVLVLTHVRRRALAVAAVLVPVSPTMSRRQLAKAPRSPASCSRHVETPAGSPSVCVCVRVGVSACV